MPNFENNLQILGRYFQGGVRRSVLIFCAVGIILAVPSFFLGSGLAVFWANFSLNSSHLKLNSIINPVSSLSVSQYTISRTQRINLDNGETVFYASINNKTNVEVGYLPFVYNVKLLDQKNTSILEKNYSEYLLPGETKYIIASSGDAVAQNLEITPSKTDSQPVKLNQLQASLSQRVNLEIRNPVVTNLETETNLKLSFLIKNNEIVKLKTVDLVYIVRDDRDRVVGIGKYQIQNLRAFEEREISLDYPKPKTRKATRLTVSTQVNYLDENNIELE